MEQQTAKLTETQKILYKVSTFLLEFIASLIIYAFAASIVSIVIIGETLLLKLVLSFNLSPFAYSMTNFVSNHLIMSFWIIFFVIFFAFLTKDTLVFLKQLWREFHAVSNDSSHW